VTGLLVRLAVIGAVALPVAGFTGAFTAANVVPTTNVGTQGPTAITTQNLAPAACNGMGLTTLVTNGVGTLGNDLMLGTAGADALDGNKGDDCIVAGGGNDLNITGGNGVDVCIGGPGADTFANSCETQIQ
jgi:Ca2+-binding RTX toxin-like protein